MLDRARADLLIAGLASWVAFVALRRDQVRITGKSVPAALWQNLGFFTDLGNLTVAIAFTVAALGTRWAGPRLLGQAMVAILLVATGYWTIGCGYVVFGTSSAGDMLGHAVTPVVAAIVWLVAAPKQGIAWRDALRWLAFPAVYLPYALARGLVGGVYPYGWRNGARHGWDSVAIFVGIFFAIALCLGLLIAAVAKLLARRAAPAT